MNRTDDMYGDFPTLEEIKRDYNELIEMVGDLTTIEQLNSCNEAKNFTIEVNGEFFEDFVKNGGTDSKIESIRYEAYGCLSYIYFFIEDGIITDIIFDVWSNKLESDFITNTSIDNAEVNYETYIYIAENN